MGTRSRLVIKRFTKKDIYLWMHWDGYFEGVGIWLCQQIMLLLKKYSLEKIQEMIEKIEIKDVEKYQCFDTKDLIEFIEGKTDYCNDECDDIEYEYILNIESKSFIGIHFEDVRVLSLSQIETGMDFTDLDSEKEKEKLGSVKSADMIICMFNMLNNEDKDYVRSKIL